MQNSSGRSLRARHTEARSGLASFNTYEGYLGREESAADSFASYLLLADAPDSELVDALWGVFSLFQSLGEGHQHYADEHESIKQRLANFSCMLAAKSPQLTPKLIESNFLTASRCARCRGEWMSAQRAVMRMRK